MSSQQHESQENNLGCQDGDDERRHERRERRKRWVRAKLDDLAKDSRMRVIAQCSQGAMRQRHDDGHGEEAR